MARVKTKAGKRLTGAAIEGLAREAEAGYDLSKAKPEPAQAGRPSLEEGVSPRISYRVAKSLYARAKDTADKEGRTVSEVAREALERYVS
jgi:hypothetical protein